MMPTLRLVGLMVGVATICGCSMDSCREYSKYTCAQLEKQTYNVYYYDKDARTGEEQEFPLGQTIGLQSCGTLAWNKAAVREDERGGEWSYICCLQTSDSACAEKHR